MPPRYYIAVAKSPEDLIDLVDSIMDVDNRLDNPEISSFYELHGSVICYPNPKDPQFPFWFAQPLVLVDYEREEFANEQANNDHN
jgi:hypothetical protein